MVAVAWAAKRRKEDDVEKYQAKRANPLPTVTVEVYVPNRDRHGRPYTTYDAWVSRVESAVCAVSGGGCTTYRGEGVWQGRRERVTIIRGSVDAARWARSGSDVVTDVVGAFGEDANQDLAGYTVDGQWFWAVPAER